MPPGPGTETTGRIRPPGNASHSRGPSVAGSSGTLPMTTIFARLGGLGVGRLAAGDEVDVDAESIRLMDNPS